jgi:phytoene synthase
MIGAEEIAQSRTAINHGSKSFALASRFFSSQVREDATLLYAWCRYCDDMVDGEELGMNAVAQDSQYVKVQLEILRRQTENVLAGDAPENSAFAGLQHVVERYAIPHRFPLALIDGFLMDVRKRRYETLNDTLDYAYHVAGVVGVMMAYILGARSALTLRYAADLGIAFQLTNIARDVYEDARLERMYLPGLWLRQAGIPDGVFALREYPDATFVVVKRLLNAAEPYYESARWGLPPLGFRSAWAVAAARRVYRRIGLEVIKNGPQGLARRTVVRRAERIKGALQSVFVALRAVMWDQFSVPPKHEFS